MALDWLPGNKPNKHHEEEFFRLFDAYRSRTPGHLEDDELERYQEISVSAYRTLEAPQVGIDSQATEWIIELYHHQRSDLTVDEWLREYHGFYVIPLVPPCDGVPLYSNGSPGGYVEPFSFRAQLLDSAEHIIGTALLEEAWNSMTTEEMNHYAHGQVPSCV